MSSHQQNMVLIKVLWCAASILHEHKQCLLALHYQQKLFMVCLRMCLVYCAIESFQWQSQLNNCFNLRFDIYIMSVVFSCRLTARKYIRTENNTKTPEIIKSLKQYKQTHWQCFALWSRTCLFAMQKYAHNTLSLSRASSKIAKHSSGNASGRQNNGVPFLSIFLLFVSFHLFLCDEFFLFLLVWNWIVYTHSHTNFVQFHLSLTIIRHSERGWKIHWFGHERRKQRWWTFGETHETR